MPINDSFKKAVEKRLRKLLERKDLSSKEELSALNTSIKYLAVLAKLETEEWGKDLDDLNEEDEKGGKDEFDNDS